MNSLKNILFVSQIDKSDLPYVGNWAVNLSVAASLKIPVPNAFIITPHSFSVFGAQSKIQGQIEALLHQLNRSDPQSVMHVSSQIKSIISNASFPNELAYEIISAYQSLNPLPARLHQKIMRALSNSEPAVSVSATVGPNKKEFQNIRGESNLLLAVKSCWQESFSPGSLTNARSENTQQIVSPVFVQSFPQTQVTARVNTQKNEKSPFVKIQAVLGLGSLIESGKITPDVYEIDRQTHHIVLEVIAQQQIQLLPLHSGGTVISPVAKRQGQARKLTIGQITELSRFAQKLQQHLYFPQVCDFSISKKQIFLTSVHQHESLMTVLPSKTTPQRQTFTNPVSDVEIVQTKFPHSWQEVSSGTAFSPGIKIGHAKFVFAAHDFSKLNPGDVLIVSQLSKQHLGLISKAGAVITLIGSKHDPYSSLIRKKGIPHLQVENSLATLFKDNQLIKVSASEGKIFKSV